MMKRLLLFFWVFVIVLDCCVRGGALSFGVLSLSFSCLGLERDVLVLGKMDLPLPGANFIEFLLNF